MAILEAVGPDVIFEEIRSSDFEARYRDPSKHTLEMRAIIRYLKVKPSARQVPVDDFAIPDSFGRDMINLEKYVVLNSIEYGELMDEIGQKTHFLGLRYMNSPEFEALNKRANESFEKTIAMSGSEDLKNRLSMFNDQVQRREASMVGNIYEFCRNNPFKEGVFLVGAAHISSIHKNIETRMKTEANLVAWNRLRQ